MSVLVSIPIWVAVLKGRYGLVYGTLRIVVDGNWKNKKIEISMKRAK